MGIGMVHTLELATTTILGVYAFIDSLSKMVSRCMNNIILTIVLVATATTQGQLLSAPKRRRTNARVRQYYHQRHHQQQKQHVSVIQQNIQAVAPKFRERVGNSSIQWEKRRLVEPVEILEEVKEERKLVVEESMSMATLSMIVESRFDIPADAEDSMFLDTSMSMSMQLLTELEFSFSMSMSYLTMETPAESTKEIYTAAGSTHGNTLMYAGAVAGMLAMVLAAIVMFIKMRRVHARQVEEGCQDKAPVPPELADFDEELFVSVSKENSGAAIEQMEDNRSNTKNNSANLSWVNPV
jgi:hypothetical protein